MCPSLSALCQQPLWQLEVSLSLGGSRWLKCSDVNRGQLPWRGHRMKCKAWIWSLELLTDEGGHLTVSELYFQKFLI